jgi:ubiquinone/menaquinone biosynthesis C-methylase UbiE
MDKIKEYWDQRAEESKGDPSATTSDIYLRKLESLALTDTLLKVLGAHKANILDVGCGDGQTTITLAERFPHATFYGIDFSPQMISSAQKALRGTGHSGRMNFVVGDARRLDSSITDIKFDAILTNRCLINIADKEEQWLALRQIADHLTPGGWYIGTENFLTGQHNLTAMRTSLGLPEIPIRWHNQYFDEGEFVCHAEKIFRNVELVNFSSAYYFVTRCVYSALCLLEGVTPDYEHPIHEIAIKVPSFGDYSPIKMIRAQS